MKNKISTNGIWIIGDTHGEYNKLVALIDKLPKDAEICFTGDLIDRGEESAHIVELIIRNGWSCVLGNHEQMMIEAHDGGDSSNWECGGGRETLDSYEDFSNEIYFKHIEWMKELPYFLYFEFDGYKPLVVSHSYIHDVWMGKDYDYLEKEMENVLWRHMFDNSLFNNELEIENNIFNIFGHTPVPEVIIESTYSMVDTGATYKNKKYGKLSAIHYPSLEVVNGGANIGI